LDKLSGREYYASAWYPSFPIKTSRNGFHGNWGKILRKVLGVVVVVTTGGLTACLSFLAEE